MANTSSDLEGQVLEVLATWEDSAAGHDELSVKELTEKLNLPATEADRVARSVKRLVDAGQIEGCAADRVGRSFRSRGGMVRVEHSAF